MGDKKGDALKPEGEISRRELLQKLSPLGKVHLDAASCTGCGLCALECPTRALTIAFRENTDVFELLFKHGLCVGCNLCADICPEKCLRLERVLKPAEMNRPQRLFRDTIVRCPECGKPVGPKAMVEKLRSRMGNALPSLTRQAELCPECKASAYAGQLKV